MITMTIRRDKLSFYGKETILLSFWTRSPKGYGEIMM